MKNEQKNAQDPVPENPRMPLTRRNYVLLAIGFAVVLLGFVLMAGGGSDSPDEFNYAMFSWRRITLAPILVIGGSMRSCDVTSNSRPVAERRPGGETRPATAGGPEQPTTQDPF